ncbi:MAG: hypothetical protein QME81_12740, partial [bacterium]|nr:hypothetical protein [bacterium]
MPLAEEMKDTVDNIISSYEARIRSISDIFDTTHQLLQGFHESFLDTRQEREKINTQLRESLAQNGSLRRKDFDLMMEGILSTQEEREKEVKNLLGSYLNEQKEMAQTLRDHLARVKDALAKGDAQRVRDFQDLIKDILAGKDERKNEVISRLKDFQKEQQEMTKRFQKLLAEGRQLRIKDLKAMLKEMAANWQSLAAAMAKKRGAQPTVAAKVKVRPAAEVVKEKPKEVKPKPVEEKPKEVKPRVTEDQMLDLLKQHYEGMTLSQLGDELGVHFVTLTGPMR